MNCPDDMELARWTDGCLPRARAEAIARHLEECLECRLVAGDPAGEKVTEALEEEEDERGPLTLPPFEELVVGLHAAYRGRPESDRLSPDPVFAADMPILMAADTDGRTGTATIPSYHGEDGRLVVTFRVDEASRVTAFFVHEDVERARFRVLRVGDRYFLGDSDGRVVLSGVKADEMLGSEISVPPLIATAAQAYPSLVSAGETDLDLLPWGGTTASKPWRLQLTVDVNGLGLRLRLEGMPPEGALVVAIADDRTAQLLFFSEDAVARCPLGAPPPGVVEFHLLSRS